MLSLLQMTIVILYSFIFHICCLHKIITILDHPSAWFSSNRCKMSLVKFTPKNGLAHRLVVFQRACTDEQLLL